MLGRDELGDGELRLDLVTLATNMAWYRRKKGTFGAAKGGEL